MKRVLPLIAASTLISGCASMAPDYVRPPSPVENRFTNVSTHTLNASKTLSDLNWEEFCLDPKLKKLISLTLENNRDLKIATLNVKRLKELYQIQKSELLPKIDASASANFQRIPEGLSGSNKAKTIDQYSVGLGILSYEIDMFGRVKSLEKGSLENYLATEHGAKALEISLISQTAATYLTLAADREKLKIAEKTAEANKKSLSLVKEKYDAGLVSALSLYQSKGNYESSKGEVSRLKTVVDQDRNLLNLAVGSIVDDTLVSDSISDSTPVVFDIPAGITSETLLKRPDILQAESALKAANANIGAARALLFPRITLVSNIGVGSDELSGLFKSGAFAWNVSPKISLPIFDGGASKSNLKIAETDKKIAVARYEKAVQTAFREVRDTLALKANIDDQLSAQRSLLDAASESSNIAEARFNEGADSYLTLLDAYRSKYSAEQALVSTRLIKYINQINLYKAMLP